MQGTHTQQQKNIKCVSVTSMYTHTRLRICQSTIAMPATALTAASTMWKVVGIVRKRAPACPNLVNATSGNNNEKRAFGLSPIYCIVESEWSTPCSTISPRRTMKFAIFRAGVTSTCRMLLAPCSIQGKRLEWFGALPIRSTTLSISRQVARNDSCFHM